MTKVAIIGDIHGQANQLRCVLDMLDDRQLVLVGDYVNRGQAVKGTLDILLDLKSQQPSTVFLLGNHDVLLLDFVDGTLPFVQFAALGGLSTIRSYLALAHNDVREEFLEQFPREHRKFLLTCVSYFETPKMIVSHCGINPHDPGSRSREDMGTTTHEDLFLDSFHPDKLVICGHYSQPSHLPRVANNLMCIDTGCSITGAPLTALLLPEKDFIQC